MTGRSLERRSDIDYEAFRQDKEDAEPTARQINSWIEGEEGEEEDDPENFYGNNYSPGLGWN